jgi:homocysteine S-methyltransferase
VAAIGVNCTSPQYINELIQQIKSAAPDKAIIVYPNSGEHYDPQNKTWHGTSTPQACGAAAVTWLEAGASIIGGCCRMGPEHIQSMKKSLFRQF